MCLTIPDGSQRGLLLQSTAPHEQPLKKSKVRVHRLTRYLIRRKNFKGKSGRHMELKNLKLFLENQSIIEENEELRKKAILLEQENLSLLAELHKRTWPC